jgi:hypothetical protein
MSKGQSIPAQMQEKHDAIWALLEPFCRAHLNDVQRQLESGSDDN